MAPHYLQGKVQTLRLATGERFPTPVPGCDHSILLTLALSCLPLPSPQALAQAIPLPGMATYFSTWKMPLDL